MSKFLAKFKLVDAGGIKKLQTSSKEARLKAKRIQAATRGALKTATLAMDPDFHCDVFDITFCTKVWRIFHGKVQKSHHA